MTRDWGRFTSADPFVQFPHYSQSFNRYSYVLNNPLSLTDPSGHFSSGNCGCDSGCPRFDCWLCCPDRRHSCFRTSADRRCQLRGCSIFRNLGCGPDLGGGDSLPRCGGRLWRVRQLCRHRGHHRRNEFLFAGRQVWSRFPECGCWRCRGRRTGRSHRWKDWFPICRQADWLGGSRWYHLRSDGRQVRQWGCVCGVCDYC